MMFRSKFNAKKTEIDGIRFDSKKESERYLELKTLQQAGEIYGLELQVNFPIYIGKTKVCTYRADFVYNNCKGEKIIEDVKGYKTPTYKLKKKLFEACYPFWKITEV